MKISQKVKSIGFRTSGGMALLLMSVVLVAFVGIRGIGSLTGAVSQTVDTSKVLIGANKAEGAIIQFYKQTLDADHRMREVDQTFDLVSVGWFHADAAITLLI